MNEKANLINFFKRKREERDVITIILLSSSVSNIVSRSYRKVFWLESRASDYPLYSLVAVACLAYVFKQGFLSTVCQRYLSSAL